MRRMKLGALSAGLIAVLAIAPIGRADELTGRHDGNWEGTEFYFIGSTVFLGQMGFDVGGEAVTSFTLPVAIVGSSGCSVQLGTTTLDLSSDPAPIEDGGFVIHASAEVDDATITFDIDGTFDSDTEASGSATTSGTSGSCSGSVTAEWDATWTLPDYQPDALLKAFGGSYVGGDVYDRTGKRETVTKTIARGRSQAYWLAVTNDGLRRDKIEVQGPDGSGGVSIRYFDTDGHDETRWVKTGGIWWNVPPQSGSWGWLKIVVSVSENAPLGTEAFRVVETSRNDPNAVDAVLLKVKVKR